MAIANGTESYARLNSFDDLVSDLVDAGQVYEDTTERTIMFKPIELWLVGEPNTVEYTIPCGFEEGNADWIGIYRVRLIKGVLRNPILIQYPYYCRRTSQA